MIDASQVLAGCSKGAVFDARREAWLELRAGSGGLHGAGDHLESDPIDDCVVNSGMVQKRGQVPLPGSHSPDYSRKP